MHTYVLLQTCYPVLIPKNATCDRPNKLSGTVSQAQCFAMDQTAYTKCNLILLNLASGYNKQNNS